MPTALPLLLDGPMGTELAARGVATPAPGWSAWALDRAPEVVGDIHRAYAEAGATIHTANTFRTRRRAFPHDWERLARRAVSLAREAVPRAHRVAGSLAPLEDCYEPWNSPAEPRPEHRELALVLADAGVDLLLCETFPHVGEGLVAVEEAARTGVETWAAFTAGPRADLLTPEAVAEAARAAVDRGAAVVLVNCVPADRTLAYVERLQGIGVPFGAYANAGDAADGIGWGPTVDGPARYLHHVEAWVEAGASVVGGCCGTGPAHLAAVARRFARR